jgi:hypothetical protein
VTEPAPLRQEAPYPHALAALVGAFRYKPGWTARLADIERGDNNGGLTLTIVSDNPDSYAPADFPDKRQRVAHLFIVPAATYNLRSWSRWLFDRIVDVETHEAAEFARFVVDDVTTRPWAPCHSPGNDPYFVYTLSTDEEQRTLQDGKVLGGPRVNALDLLTKRLRQQGKS